MVGGVVKSKTPLISKVPVARLHTVGTTVIEFIEQEQLGSVEGRTVTVETAVPAPQGPLPLTVKVCVPGVLGHACTVDPVVVLKAGEETQL